MAAKARKRTTSVVKIIDNKLGRYARKAGELTAVGILMYGVVTVIVPYLDRQWNSDSAPLEGKEQHVLDLQTIEKARQTAEKAHDEAQAKIVQQLDATAQTLTIAIAKQQQDYRDNLSQQLERAQNALNTAKTFYEKDKTSENLAVVEALKDRLMEIQKQVMEINTKR